MSETLDYNAVAPEAVRPLYEAQKGTSARFAAQRMRLLSGAAHARRASAWGSIDRLSGVAAWHDAPWYSARERAALEWTEALTLVAKARPPIDLLARVKGHFSDREIVYLTMAINTINSWNRFNVAFETSPERAEEVFRMLHPQAAPAHA